MKKLRLMAVVSSLGLMVTVATGLAFLEAPANYSGFNQSYVYGFPLGWFIVEKITAPTAQVREIIHIAIAQLVSDFVIWTTIVGAVVVAVKSLRGHQTKVSNSTAQT